MNLFRAQALAVLALLAFVSLVASAPQSSNDDDYDYGDEEEKETEIHNVPDFISSSKVVKTAVGRKLKLDCQVNDLSSFILIWTHNKSNILKMGNTRLNKDVRIHFRDINGRQGETITIDDVIEADAGRYECQIASDPPKSIFYDVQVVEASELEAAPEAEAEGEAETAASDGDDDNAAAAHGAPVFGAVLAAAVALVAARAH